MNSTVSLSSSSNLTLEQVSELRAAGLQELYSIRSQAMKLAVEDLQGCLQESPSAPHQTIPWKLSSGDFGLDMFCSILDPHAWELLRAHLAARTAVHMAGHDFGNGVTGFSMARHIGADLHTLALDGWRGLTAFGISTIGGSSDVC